MTNGVVWDLKSYFEDFNSPDMKDFKAEIKKLTDELQALSSAARTLDKTNQNAWEELFLKYENLFKMLSHYSSYIGCLASADADNEDYSGASAELDEIIAQFSKVEINFKTALKSCDDKSFEMFCKREKLSEIAFNLNEMRTEAQKTMSKELETLATELGVNGFSSWGRLYDKITGKLTFEMVWPNGEVKNTPISQCRSLMQDSDRKVRKSAFDNGNKAWQSVEDICAAALNSIAGTRLYLNEKRNINHFLDVALFQSRISRKTMDAMFEAIAECRPFIQQIAKAKAKALGQEKLAWYDCEAPLNIPSINRFSWDECVKMNIQAFGRAYPALKDFFIMALEKNWIESEPRKGKIPGAFCTGSILTEESRVFMSYSGSLSDVSTLAHEIGHAFHGAQLKGLRPMKKEYPMTLAESASTFAELLLADGILSDPETSQAQKLNVLTGNLNHAIAFLIDIPIRFNFEKSFYEERANGVVSVSKLKQLMTDAMKNQFGDLLENDGANPYFWASKMHFYITEVSFYNYPYTFGYLLSRGLFEMFKKEGTKFLPRYEQFLRESGSDMAHIIAQKTLDANLEKTEFWKQAIMGYKSELEQFENLAGKVFG